MAVFEDYFSTNTLDEYEVLRGRENVSWDEAGEQLLIRAGNNEVVLMSRDEIEFPAQGCVRLRMVVQKDFHVTNRIRIGWVEDDEDILNWQASGDAPDSSPWADSYDDWVRVKRDGVWEVLDRSPGSVGPSSEERLVEARWTESSMTLSVDGEAQATTEIDTTQFSPGRFTLSFSQGHIDLKSVAVCALDSSNTISASLSTLQFIPGKSENPSEGGDILNSALMHIIPEEGIGVNIGGREISAKPVYDNWIGGDMIETDEFPTTLEEARKKKAGKYRDDTGANVPFNQYRIENGVTVSFETTSGGGVDSDTVELTFHETGSAGDDPKVSRGNQENSKTVLHEHELNGIPWREWYGANVTSSRRKTRYYVYDDEYEFDGVGGVRVLTVWGGYAGFVQDISDRTTDNPATFLNEVWDWDAPEWIAQLAMWSLPTAVQFAIQSLAVIPNSYSVLEFIVLADGRRYARVWDASAYPSLVTYLDGERVATDPMQYQPKEQLNIDMVKLYLHAISGLSPYEELSIRYFITKIQNQQLLEGELEDSLIRTLRLIDFGWSRDELMPEIPRETEGTRGKQGPPIANPDEPFDSSALMNFMFADELPPN